MTTGYRYVNVKTYRTKTGRSCILSYCGAPARVMAERKRPGRRMRLPVQYCQTHADERGIPR